MEVRRAEWRLREGERWTVWRLARYWVDLLSWVDRIGFLVMAIAVLVSYVRMDPMPGVYALLIPPLMLLFRSRKIPARIRDLAPWPSDLPQHAVWIEVIHRNQKIGMDQGVLTFVDGWMHFEGLRMSFSIQPVDVLEFSAPWSAFGGIRVSLHDAQGETSLRISPLSSRSDISAARRRGKGLVDDVKAWKGIPATLQGESMYPPCKIHPMSEASWRFIPVSRLLFWLTFLGIILRKHDSTDTMSFWVWTFMWIMQTWLWAIERPHRRRLAMAVPTLPALGGRNEEEPCLPVKR